MSSFYLKQFSAGFCQLKSADNRAPFRTALSPCAKKEPTSWKQVLKDDDDDDDDDDHADTDAATMVTMMMTMMVMMVMMMMKDDDGAWYVYLSMCLIIASWKHVLDIRVLRHDESCRLITFIYSRWLLAHTAIVDLFVFMKGSLVYP